MSNRGIMVFYKSLLSAVVLVAALAQQSEAALRAIRVENIGAALSVTPEGLLLTWGNPDDDIGSHCYESTVRFKTACEPSWENVTLAKFSYVLRTSRHEDYQFQLRMRYRSACDPSRRWTSWTQTLSLGNANDTVCSLGEEPPAQPITTLYLLILLPVLLCLLLMCSLTLRERVRRYFLPIIPDPKHRLDGLLKMEHRADPDPECETETVDIEIVNSERKGGGPGEEKLLEKNTDANGNGGKGSWARCSLTEAELQGYPTLPNSGEYIVYNGMHPE